MRQKAIGFKSGDLTLEGVVAFPDETPGAAPGTFPGVVMCHPGPTGGGNMNNNVVLAVCNALVDAGFATLRFNFRGVGSSEGTYAGGEKEPEDAEAALRYLKGLDDVDSSRLGMAGYSFGTGVILRALSRYKESRAFALFSAPNRYVEELATDGDQRPKLFICGDRDHVAEITSMKQQVEALGETARLQVVPGVDHFWGGREEEGADYAVRFFLENLKQ
jgi:alpha/beta superfamily hydrolase